LWAVALAVRRWRRPRRSPSAPPAPSRRSPYPPACPSGLGRRWADGNGFVNIGGPEWGPSASGDLFGGTASVHFIAAPLAPSGTGAGGALFAVGPGPAEPFASARYLAPLNQAVGALRAGAHAHLRPAAPFLSPAAPPRPAGMPRRGPSPGPVELEPRRRTPTATTADRPTGTLAPGSPSLLLRASRKTKFAHLELQRSFIVRVAPIGVSHLPESHRLGDKRPYGCVVRVKDRLDRRRGPLPSHRPFDPAAGGVLEWPELTDP
jgi:hypothetical protein